MNNFRFLVLFVALISAAQLFADSQSDDKTQVSLNEKLYISVTCGPHRAPAKRRCPLVLMYDEEKQELEFSNTTAAYGIIVNMYDKDENLVKTNTIDVLQNEATFVPISDLVHGEYRIETIIDDICYEGTFVVY